jgi:hypothetical protein
MLKIEIVPMKNRATTDIEAQFSEIQLVDTVLNRTILREIEQAEYCDEYSFIDRFGYKLRKDNLSTGCKAALIVANRPDIKIDTQECGYNAIGVIVTRCKKGNIILMDTGLTIPYDTDDESQRDIDVELDGYRFTDIDRLNEYLKYMQIPKDGTPGVEKLR